MDTEELQGYADDAVAYFGEDPNTLVVSLAGGAVQIHIDLSKIVEETLDVMETEREADDMLDLSRQFAYLSKLIRQAVGGHVQNATRGEP